MGLKLTKKDALLICVRLWDWLYENPEIRDKTEWPGWDALYDTYDVDEFFSDCPCCEWVNQQGYHLMTEDNDFAGLDCSKCPLTKIFPNGCTGPVENTSWDTWCVTYDKDKRKLAAKIIRDGSFKELKKLK